MQNDKAMYENPYVGKMVLEQVGEPSGYLFSKALNVYDNKYRVNIYTRTMRGQDKDLEGISISQSYFVRLDNNTVTILSQSIYKDRANRGSQRKTVKQEII